MADNFGPIEAARPPQQALPLPATISERGYPRVFDHPRDTLLIERGEVSAAIGHLVVHVYPDEVIRASVDHIIAPPSTSEAAGLSSTPPGIIDTSRRLIQVAGIEAGYIRSRFRPSLANQVRLAAHPTWLDAAMRQVTSVVQDNPTTWRDLLTSDVNMVKRQGKNYPAVQLLAHIAGACARQQRTADVDPVERTRLRVVGLASGLAIGGYGRYLRTIQSR